MLWSTFYFMWLQVQLLTLLNIRVVLLTYVNSGDIQRLCFRFVSLVLLTYSYNTC